MVAYPDTSFLRALYRKQDNSEQALAYRDTMAEPLHEAVIQHLESAQQQDLASDNSAHFSRVPGLSVMGY